LATTEFIQDAEAGVIKECGRGKNGIQGALYKICQLKYKHAKEAREILIKQEVISMSMDGSCHLYEKKNV
jgi:hypothetical protein